MKASKANVNKLMANCASMKNPPKGYGSIETGMKVTAYRNKRLDYWAKQIGNGGYTPEVFERAEVDVVAEWGKAF